MSLYSCQGEKRERQKNLADTPLIFWREKIKWPCRKTVIKYISSTEMSTNFKSISISITADFVRPTVPDYEESSQTIIFTTADKFEE